MSKLLTALQKLDAQSASKSAPPPFAPGAPMAQPPAEPVDPLSRIAELNKLLEETLGSQRSWLANKLAVRTGFEKSLHPVAAPTPTPPYAALMPTALERPALEPALSSAAANVVPLSIAREFVELAAKLSAEIQIPAALAFTTADKANNSCFWLCPLAIALSQIVPSRFLIIEATADEPRWARQLGIESAKRLVDALAAPAEWRDSVVPTAVSRIDCLPGGIGNLSATVDVRQSFRELVVNLKSEYGIILVTAGQAESPIARILTSECGHAVLNVGLQKTGRAAAARAKRSLESTGTRLIGSVVCG